MNTRRMAAILTVLSVFLFAGLATPDSQAATYSFTTLDVPDAANTWAASINASGQVAGNYSPDGWYSFHGFLYSGGTFTILDVPGTARTEATSINASGQVAGSYSDSLDSLGSHGFVYSNGTFTILDVPGATSTYATSINASGQVTGGYYYSDSWSGFHGFLYSGGTFTAIAVPGATSTSATSINASGQVAGSYSDSLGSHGFVYSNGTFTTFGFPNAQGIWVTSINASGQVAGCYCNKIGRMAGPWDCQGFVYNDGTSKTFDTPGAVPIYDASINDSGQVAGSYSDSLGSHGFLYSNGAFTTLDVPGATGTIASSINASGQVTGRYGDGSHTHGFIATPICAAPTVAIHTLTTAPHGWFRITGSITLDGVPLCTLVLANGQFMFTCGDPLPKGTFDLTVPVDDQGQITLFGFSSGLAPFQQTLGLGALPASVNATSCATPKVTYTTAAAPEGKFRLTGSITLGGDPLCALVLANGQFLFTCGDPLPKGTFDLTVPPDDQGKITLFGFAAGLVPFQQTFSPSPSTPP